LSLKKALFALIIVLQFLSTSCSKRVDSNYNDNSSIQTHSISSLIKQSKNNNLPTNERRKLLLQANDLVNQLSDSAHLSNLSKISYQFIILKDSSNFFKLNTILLNSSKKANNIYYQADAHWNFADYFLFREIYNKSYYHHEKARNLFESIGKRQETAKVLRDMAFTRGRYRDYSGSEALQIEAIKIFKDLKLNRQLYHSYNKLAILQNDIKNYDKALEYHEKALEYLNKIKNKRNFYSTTFNNIGITYLEKGEYQNALIHFNKALSLNKTRESYARIISNISLCKLKLGDTLNLKKNLFEALKIRDSLDNKAGVVASRIAISEYYEYKNDIENAIKYAKDANSLSREIQNGGEYLKSLKQLSDLLPNKSDIYLNEYIRFNDSLIGSDRNNQNKFTRIEFETDEVIEQNKTLGQRMTWIISGSIVLLLFLSLLYFIRVQKVKNEKLFLETEQQKANEQVYLLTLKQQATLEEERTKERNRISQELHDGILGRLFGTRVGLGFLDFEADEKTQEQHEAFLEELQDIEKEIREVSHKLNDNFTDPDVNFTTIVTQLLESKSQVGDFQFHLNIDENISWKQTDEIIKVNVYRIIQETLQNTIKHAKAKNVTLDFSTNASELWIQIKDDGIGFNTKKFKKGIGLKNMKSRVEKLNGTLEIESAMHKGTQIHIKIPLV
jgi:signal transduction histidine kinase